MGKFKDLTGQTFGRLLVLNQAGYNKSGNALWLCKCACGNEKVVTSSNIVRGDTTSCGCYQKQRASELGLSDGEASFNEVFNTYKRNAIKRKLTFELSKDIFRQMTQDHCHYCGALQSNTHKSRNMRGDFKYNGVDRIDSTKGYTLDNVVTCCGICNKAKYTLSTAEFSAWIERIYTWQKNMTLE